MFNQQLDNLKAVRAINVIKRIEGIPVQPGLVVPAELTVAYPKEPTVTFKVVPPPVPEYKRVEIPAYKPELREPSSSLLGFWLVAA